MKKRSKDGTVSWRHAVSKELEMRPSVGGVCRTENVLVKTRSFIA